MVTSKGPMGVLKYVKIVVALWGELYKLLYVGIELMLFSDFQTNDNLANFNLIQWRIYNFPDAMPTPKGRANLLFDYIFPKTAWKWKHFGA